MKNPKRIVLLLGVIILALNANLSLAQDDSSHSKSTDPDYAVVFPQEAVNSITITITPDTWQSMMDDMTNLYGEAGTQTMGGPNGGPSSNAQPPNGERPAGGQPPSGGIPNGGQPPVMGGGIPGFDENPIWVTVDVAFNDETWSHVGMRFKGNSSLMSSWGGGSLKLGFKLNFDKFEDDYPEIEDQRFFGFKELSFSNNWSDSSFLREKVTADVFREAGVPSAHTAFYAVYVDYGDGPNYFGLYTAVEAIEDTVLDTQFEDNDGNLYKPEGTGASFAEGTFSEEWFSKETNEDEADYSDIIALFDVLHSETRTTDPEQWRNNLEAIFDADGFMLWLAVNSVVQNWDTYGSMEHNYYLYNDPTTGQLTWIPWDNNMALSEGMGGGFGRRGQANPTASGTTSLDQANITSDWPLIRFLMDDPVYYDLYVTYVDETIKGAFEPSKMQAIYETFHELIAPYVVGENGEIEGYTLLSSPEDFEASVAELINHVNRRYTAAQEYVNSLREIAK